MPGSYPPAPPTLSGDLLTISRFLQSPTQLSKALRSIMSLRFISDQLLTAQYKTSGGAIAYEIDEAIINSRAVTAVAPGSAYPFDMPGSGTAALAAVSKWGQAVFLSDEKIKRSVYQGQEVARTMQKSVNTVINKVESVTTAAIGSAITATQAASAAWNASTPTMFRDLELASAKVVDLNMGFTPDTVLMSTTKYAYLISDLTVASLRPRETPGNPINGGKMVQIGGFNIVYTSVGNLPSDDVWVVDSTQLGGMADEINSDPGYVTVERNIQVQTERIAGRDGWNLWARRLTVPVVQEPSAGIKVTGT